MSGRGIFVMRLSAAQFGRTAEWAARLVVAALLQGPEEILIGGQAVIEGVVIRGMRTIGLAVRKPSGVIYRYREPIDSPLQRSRVARLPFVRGVIVLWESLVIGVRMLMRSANVALEDESVKLEGGSAVGFVVTTLAIALALFVGLPYLATQAIHGIVADARMANILEGALRMALFLGYVSAISLPT